MASSKYGDPVLRRCVSTQTQVQSDNSTSNGNKATASHTMARHNCNCHYKTRYERATEAVIKPQASRDGNNSKQIPVPKKTCTRCYSRRESIPRELEPCTGSITQFYETYDDIISLPSTPSASSECNVKQTTSRIAKTDDNLTPKEIMNTWIPGKDKPALFTPNDNYVDVSPNDFSMRKYFPEFFLSETEKKKLRDKELEETQEKQRQGASKQNYGDLKCPQGSCSGSKEVRDVNDWQTMVTESTIQAHCSWSDREIVHVLERDEVANKKSNVRPQTSSKRPFRWFLCPCGKLKEEKKPDKKK